MRALEKGDVVDTLLAYADDIRSITIILKPIEENESVPLKKLQTLRTAYKIFKKDSPLVQHLKTLLLEKLQVCTL